MNELLSVIIPCFNEEEVINETYRRLKNIVDENNYKYEFIFINDGSSDNTLKILKKFADADKNTKVLSFSRNFGHQCAVTAGLNQCLGDIAIIIDADLQDPPELFPEMIKLYNQGFDVVYGVRKERKGENIFKKITAKVFYRLLNKLSDVKLPLDTGDFRLISSKVIKEYKNLPEKNKYIRGLISWLGFKQIPIYYDRDARFAGVTKYPLKKMIKFASTGLLYFSKKPLKLALNLGFFSIMISFILIFYAFFSKFFLSNETVPGWSSTLIIILFLGGIQLFTIGIMGEYIGNIFDELKGRPEYIIEEKVNFNTDTKEK